MIQHNQRIKKQRFVAKTILIFGEGLDDKTFLDHLKKEYCMRNSGVSVTTKKGKGGDPISIVEDAKNASGLYDKTVVVLDNDKSEEEMNKARDVAKKSGIDLYENTPNLEAFLLNILEEKRKFPNSATYKSEFEKKWIHEDDRDDLKEYERVFPKSLLEYRRSGILVLDVLIKIFEGK
jgi:hypothetical protein